MEQLRENKRAPATEGRSFSLRKWALAISLVILVCVVFGNTLHNGFVFDDVSTIENNPAIRSARYIRLYFTRPFFSVGQPTSGPVVYDYYRPIVLISYLLDYHLWGLNPRGYHLTNLCLQAAAALLVFILLGKLGLKAVSAFTAAAIFAIHPALADTVAGVSGRSDPLCAIFFLTCLYCYVRGVGERFAIPPLVISYCALTMALFTKETAIAIPAILTAYELVQPDRVAGRKLSGRAASLFPIYLISFAYFLVRARVVPSSTAIQGDAGEIVRRLMTAADVTASYLLMMFLPHGLAFETFTPIANSYLKPSIIFASVLVLCLLTAAVLNLKKGPWASFFILWFFACLLPYSYFFLFLPESRFFTPPHFLYFPSVGLAALCGLAIGNLTRSGASGQNIWRKGALVASPALIVVVLLSAQTVKRNTDWRDGLTFFSRMVLHTPQSARVHIGLANALMNSGQPGSALAEYGKAYELARARPGAGTTSAQAPSSAFKGGNKGRLVISNPYAAGALAGMGDAYRTMGETLSAIDSYRLALGENAFDATTHLKLARAYESAGQFDEAIASYEKALKLDRNLKEAASSLQIARAKKEVYDRAKTVYLDALFSKRQNSPEALYSEALMLRLSGKQEAATALFRETIVKAPLHYGANLALGQIYVERGEYESAFANFSAAFAAQPTSAIAAHELAVTSLALGDTLSAEMWAAKAYDLSPTAYYGKSFKDIKIQAEKQRPR